MTLEEHILDELADHKGGMDMVDIELAMQDRIHALGSETHAAVVRLGIAGKVAQVPCGRWKLACYCSPDLINANLRK